MSNKINNPTFGGKLEDIKKLPIEVNGINQNDLRSTHVLNLVLEMINRGDSKETIYYLVGYLMNS